MTGEELYTMFNKFEVEAGYDLTIWGDLQPKVKQIWIALARNIPQPGNKNYIRSRLSAEVEESVKSDNDCTVTDICVSVIKKILTE